MNEIQDRPKRKLRLRNEVGTKHRPPKFGVCTSVYLSPLFSTEYRPLCEERYGVSGSFRLNELMLKDLAEMKGQTLPGQVNIQALEMQLANLIVRIKKLKAFLVKLGSYSDLEDLAIDWRLDVESFGNLDGIIEKFLKYNIQKTDRFTKDDIELFVQLISLVKEKALRKKELDRLRIDKIDSIGAAEDEPVSKPENTNAVTSASEGIAPPPDKSKFQTEE